MKISVFFLSENFQFLEVKFSIYLNRRVFVMCCFFPAFSKDPYSGIFYQQLPWVFKVSHHKTGLQIGIAVV